MPDCQTVLGPLSVLGVLEILPRRFLFVSGLFCLQPTCFRSRSYAPETIRQLANKVPALS